VIPIYHFLFSNSSTYIIGGTSIGSILYRGERFGEGKIDTRTRFSICIEE
jgi:hypothetical protein